MSIVVVGLLKLNGHHKIAKFYLPWVFLNTPVWAFEPPLVLYNWTMFNTIFYFYLCMAFWKQFMKFGTQNIKWMSDLVIWTLTMGFRPEGLLLKCIMEYLIFPFAHDILSHYVIWSSSLYCQFWLAIVLWPPTMNIDPIFKYHQCW